MHTETKHTAIPPRIKAAVALRDSLHGPATCIICGAPGMPCCHVVRRSRGGRGDTERNIVTLCHECHRAFDEGLGMKRLRFLGFETQKDVETFIIEYIKGFYPDWTPDGVTYHKWTKRPQADLEHRCGTCAHHEERPESDMEHLCFNRESRYFECYMEDYETCPNWEVR